MTFPRPKLVWQVAVALVSLAAGVGLAALFQLLRG